MMIKAAVDKILELAPAQIVEVCGRKYSDRKISPVLEPAPAPLTVSTLTGFVDYIKSNRDGLNYSEIIIVVESFSRVYAVSKLTGDFKQRDIFIEARFVEVSKNLFGLYIPAEEFVVSLQSRFLPTEHSKAILSIIGNVKEEAVKTTGDDGITQTVTAKLGVSLAVNVKVPNPVTLKPYRTFFEIDQPESQFIFRVKNGPECAIFEADGGKWKIDATERIKTYLEKNLPQNKAVIVIA